MTYLAMILGMALATYASKAAFFLLGSRLVFPPLLRQALDFVPVTVLTAIVTPLILSPHGEGLELTWRNPQLVASLAAITAGIVARQQLLTIVVGLAVFLGLSL